MSLTLNLTEISRRARLAVGRNASRIDALRESYEISEVAGEMLGLAFLREVTGCSLADAKEWRKAWVEDRAGWTEGPPGPEELNPGPSLTLADSPAAAAAPSEPRCERHNEAGRPLAECCEWCLNERLQDARDLSEWSATKNIAAWLETMAGSIFAGGDDAKAKFVRDEVAKRVRERAVSLRAAFDKRKEEAK